MRGLRAAAAALALVAAASFLAARGCDKVEAPPDPGTEAPTRDGGRPSLRSGPEPSVAARPRAARPAAAPDAADPTSPGPRTVKLVVLVRARPERTPIEGAVVLLPGSPEAPRAVTDANGRASFDVPPGQLGVQVRSHGRTTTRVVATCAADVTVHEVDLVPGARLDGRVTDAASGRPLPGVRVALHDGGVVDGTHWNVGPSAFAELVSDDAGRFGIDGLATGRPVTIESSLPGRATNRTALLVAEPGLVRAEISMEPGGSVIGVVRRDDGTALEGARVSVLSAVAADRPADGRVALSATTDPEGAYRVEGLDLDGVWVVECSPSPDRFVAVPGVHPTAARPEVRCDLTFAPPGSLRIELAGTRAKEDSVRVVRVVPGSIDFEVGHLADGERRELSPQHLRVEWDPDDGHPPISREVEIEPGVETVVRIERPPVHRIVGRVVGAGGRPCEGVEVSVSRRVGDWNASPDAETREDGTFEIEDVAPGPWTFEADFPGRPSVRRRIVVPCEPLLVEEPAAATLVVRLPPGLARGLVRYAVEVPETDASDGVTWEWEISGSTPDLDEPLVEGDADWTGPTRIRVAVPGFLPFERILDVEPGSHHDVVVGPLLPCDTLHGRVIDGRGRPVADAVVSLGEREPFDEVRARAETHSDGTFADLSLPPGPATVLVEAKGFADRRVELPGPPAGPLEIVLSRPGRLFVRARDRSDAPAVGREVVVVDAAGRTLDPSPATTDHRGRCELLVPPGKLRVTVGGGESVAVEVTEQGTATIDVVVP